MNDRMNEPRAGMSVELETMALGTSASAFEKLTCIRPTILQEELEKLDKSTKPLFESLRELSKQLGVKIPERRYALCKHSVLYFPLRHLPV